MRNIFFFDAMLTPKIITAVYWLALLGVLISGIGMMFYGEFFRGLFGIIVGGVFVRVAFEMIIIAFKITNICARSPKTVMLSQRRVPPGVVFRPSYSKPSRLNASSCGA